MAEIRAEEYTISRYFEGVCTCIDLLPAVDIDAEALDILPAKTFVEGEDTTALQDVLQESLRSGTLRDRRAIVELEVRLRQMLLRRACRLIRIGKSIVVSHDLSLREGTLGKSWTEVSLSPDIEVSETTSEIPKTNLSFCTIDECFVRRQLYLDRTGFTQDRLLRLIDLVDEDLVVDIGSEVVLIAVTTYVPDILPEGLISSTLIGVRVARIREVLTTGGGELVAGVK